ncbi:MAG TPA: GNAT family N-acetyltransferase, partial [Candidatus Limnocylindria bacterium]
EGAEVTISGWMKGDSPPEKRWAEGLGFTWARRFLRMRIDMRAAPPEPAWPDGVTVRSFVLGQDETLMHEALEDAFSDHWGHVPAALEDLVRRTERRDFDAGLWFMAMDGERAVATATNSIIPDQIGWISGLGTVRSHRRRGLARAILLHSFGEFWRRGIRTVALGVDADSLTGATALYESVGMRVEQLFDQVRKVLRPGEPLDVRSAG